MIEQTDMIVDEWIYIPPTSHDKISSDIVLEVMRKNAPSKKGLACRFTCKFFAEENTILLYVAQDSYVIDVADEIDANEVRRMVNNSYEKCKEKFELRKLNTVLQNTSLKPLNESQLNISQIVLMLK